MRTDMARLLKNGDEAEWLIAVFYSEIQTRGLFYSRLPFFYYW